MIGVHVWVHTKVKFVLITKFGLNWVTVMSLQCNNIDKKDKFNLFDIYWKWCCFQKDANLHKNINISINRLKKAIKVAIREKMYKILYILHRQVSNFIILMVCKKKHFINDNMLWVEYLKGLLPVDFQTD
jgi:hypothetical protein